MNKFNFLTALNNKNKLLFQLSEKVLLNEIVIKSHRQLFDYEHKGSNNGENIINVMINKTKRFQTGKENNNVTNSD